MSTADNTFGAWFIGNQVSLVAFGFLLLQCWIFSQNWNKESLVLKLFVPLTLALGFFHIFLTSHALFHYLISSLGNPQGLAEIVWSFKVEPFVSEVIVTLAHLFYIGRIYIIQKSYVLPGLLFLLTLSHTVVDLVASGLELSVKGLVAAKATAKLAQAGLSLDLVIDVVIMLAMFHFFYINRSEIRSTQHIINRLTFYTFASGSLTVVANAVILATFVTKPKTQIYSGTSFVIPHLYSNCLLAMLNSRSTLKTRDNYNRRDFANKATEGSTLDATLPVFQVNVSGESRGSSTASSTRVLGGEHSFEEPPKVDIELGNIGTI